MSVYKFILFPVRAAQINLCSIVKLTTAEDCGRLDAKKQPSDYTSDGCFIVFYPELISY